MAMKQKAKYTFDTAAMLLIYVTKAHRKETSRRSLPHKNKRHYVVDASAATITEIIRAAKM
jgi:hypothetical protein